MKTQKKRCLCCGSAASGWFGSLVLAILTSGCLSQIQVSPQQRPGQIGFSPHFCPRYNVQGEGAGAFLDSVLSCLQSSPVKQVFGSVKAMVRRGELLALPRLCLKLAHSAWITSVYPHLIRPCTTRSCNLYVTSIATTAFLQWEIRPLKLN